jgi:hypothetical protein
MVNVITRRRTAGIGTVGAILATLAMAPSADATTYYACVKKRSGSIRIVSRTTRCRRSERKISFNSEGPPGRNGSNGRNGRNGANGINGKNGANGINGINGTTGFTSTLPKGATEDGTWAVAVASGNSVFDAISFNIPLAAPPAVNVIPKGGASTPACPGTVGAPAASSGNLCVYTAINENTTILLINPSIEGAVTSGASSWGTVVKASAASSGAAYGTWAVTG